VLCSPCAELLPACEGLIPEHLSSRVDRTAAAGWVIDGFGTAHALSGARTTVGRRPQADLVLLNGSVSRDHAEIHLTGGNWALRDLGSRNGTQLDGERVQGRAALGDRAIVRFGDIALLFLGRRVTLPDPAPKSIATVHAAGAGPQRYTLRSAAVDLCLIGGAEEDSGGALLHRVAGTSAWSELSLPPLEFQFLRALCARAVAEVASPSRSRGCVPTKHLAKSLPFQSRYANEENVRQVVRRIRGTLQQIGAAELVEALPGRGYYVTWPVMTT
jgi:predicted component of type VI protein secretion system